MLSLRMLEKHNPQTMSWDVHPSKDSSMQGQVIIKGCSGCARTDHEGQELEDPLRGLLALVSGGRRDDLLAHILGHDQQHRQHEVRPRIVPPDRRRSVHKREQPVARALHEQACTCRHPAVICRRSSLSRVSLVEQACAYAQPSGVFHPVQLIAMLRCWSLLCPSQLLETQSRLPQNFWAKGAHALSMTRCRMSWA